ncbi:MAG: glycosyltransferase [Bacteroidales bacterium]|jgi:glycosyltransferase involved in cell wall biosynthesis|nr:glycosyltransferase [Bacteroidales bacterium]
MLSVIISFYKALDNLELLFLALEQQSFRDFEVIVSEDDNSPQTVEFLQQARSKFHFPILHVGQEDQGFRKCKMLNKAILAASSDKIVFLDGDCIPHKHWVKNYNKMIREGVFCIGRRVMLSQALSAKLKESKNLAYLSFVNFLRYGVDRNLKRAIYLPFLISSKNKGHNRGVLGCNMGGWKDDLLVLNGFDEDYQLVGTGEDTDLDWRLRASGVIRIQPVFWQCIVYHLYHKPTHYADCKESVINHALMVEKEKAGHYACLNGITKITK